MYWNGRFSPWIYNQQIYIDCVHMTLLIQCGPKSWRNVSTILLNLCHEELGLQYKHSVSNKVDYKALSCRKSLRTTADDNDTHTCYSEQRLRLSESLFHHYVTWTFERSILNIHIQTCKSVHSTVNSKVFLKL